jgi:hypothetical protein
MSSQWGSYHRDLRMGRDTIHQMEWMESKERTSPLYPGTVYAVMGCGEDKDTGRYTGLKVRADDGSYMPEYVHVHVCELCAVNAGGGSTTRTLYICSCAAMRGVWKMSALCYVGAGIPTATLDSIHSCRHSHALRQLLADEVHSSSPEGTAQTLLEICFSSPDDTSCSVTILNAQQGWWYGMATPAVCLSVDSGSHPCGSHPARGIIKTTAQLVYYCSTCDARGPKGTCPHLKSLETWLDQEDGLFWCHDLAPFRLASAAPTQAPLGEPESADHPSVSSRPVPFDMYNPATMERQRHTGE